MSKVTTTKINGRNVPTICKENSGNPEAYKMSMNVEGASQAEARLIALRVYFGFGSDVNMGVAKASELCKEFSANAGMISKAKKVSEHFVNLVTEGQDITETGVTIDHYAEALELCISMGYVSLNGANDFVTGKGEEEGEGEEGEEEGTTLEMMVTNLFKWADKNGFNHGDIVAEVAKQCGQI